jgi:hypothetical protein
MAMAARLVALAPNVDLQGLKRTPAKRQLISGQLLLKAVHRGARSIIGLDQNAILNAGTGCHQVPAWGLQAGPMPFAFGQKWFRVHRGS